MTINTPKTTRRAMLGAATGLALIGATPGCVRHATAAPSPDGGRWWRLHARYTALKAEADAFWRNVEDPTHYAMEAEISALPHTLATYGGSTLTTANHSHVTKARFFLDTISTGAEADPVLGAYHDACRAIVAAADEREAAKQRIHAKHGWGAIAERSDRWGDILADIETRLMKLPAPDARAAQWKARRLLGADDPDTTDTPTYTKDYAGQGIADILRFLGREEAPRI